MTPADVARAFRWACETELRALKPGNVHVHAPAGAGTLAAFRRSARVAAPWMGRRRLTVGARILGAVAATRRAVGANTTLGIVLLAAPLCHAALNARGRPLGAALDATLAALDVAEARLAFRAIALAGPAGLGRPRRADVHAPARVTLRHAMRLAARRDRVARQYATGFTDVLGIGVPALARMRAAGLNAAAAAQRLHMLFLRRFADSHIARKHGRTVAAAVRGQARRVPDSRAALLRFDRSLKRRGINPGTTADLVVASLLAWRLGALLAREGARIEPAVVQRRRHQRSGDPEPRERRQVGGVAHPARRVDRPRARPRLDRG
jgi:triphosphoribosyl-dephospho-CoA synthase